MELVILDTEAQVFELAARQVAQVVRQTPRAVLGLATGRTMEAVYQGLVRAHRDEGVDFSGVATFNLDEYVGLGPDDPNGYCRYMARYLFDHVNIDLAQTHLPDGVADDLEACCAAYEAAIVAAGGIDLQLLGIGVNGHIGFNEPLSGLHSRTRPVQLSEATIAQNQGLFDIPERMPRQALTMGIGTILEARECLLLATGASKAPVVAQMIEGPVTALIPATALQFHPRCTVILDAAAAADLAQRESYRWQTGA